VVVEVCARGVTTSLPAGLVLLQVQLASAVVVEANLISAALLCSQASFLPPNASWTIV
jgi:hypothetical protein